MTNSNRKNDLINQIAKGERTDEDSILLRQKICERDSNLLEQLAKYNINIGEGRDIQVGDRTYLELSEEALQAIIKTVQTTYRKSNLIKIVIAISTSVLIVFLLSFYILNPENAPHIEQTLSQRVEIKDVSEPTDNFKLVDVTVSEIGKSLVFDLKALNESNSIAFIHGVDFLIPSEVEPPSNSFQESKRQQHLDELQDYLGPGGIYISKTWKKIEAELLNEISISQVIPPQSPDRFQVKMPINDQIKPYIKRENHWLVNVLYNSDKSLTYQMDFTLLNNHK